MQPTEILQREHRLIEQVLGCLEKMALEAEALGRLDTEAATQAIEFFRQFADKCHHGKEEAKLFPAMEAKGFSPHNGPTAVMRYEHELGRDHVRKMAEAVQRIAAGNTAAIAQFVQHAREYVELLWEHIGKEDHCLFPMANNALGHEEQARLLAEFQEAEQQAIRPETYQECLAIAKRLGEQYGVPCLDTRDTGHTGRSCAH